MKDFLESCWDSKWIIIGCALAFAFISAVVVLEAREDKRLLQQCMDDGKKEYECHSMLDKHDQVYPVLVPIGR